MARFLINSAPQHNFKVSKDGIFWLCKRLDSRTAVYVHEVSWPGEKRVTCSVIKNPHARRHELLPKLGQQTSLHPLP